MRQSAIRLSRGFLLAVCVLTAGCRAYCPPRPEGSVAKRVNSAPPARLLDSRMPSTPPTANENDAWLVEERCGACHNIERLMRVRLDWQGWRGEVGHMVQNGAVLTVPEQQRIVDYLALRERASRGVAQPSPQANGTLTPAR